MDGLPKLSLPSGYDRAYAQSYELAFDRLSQSDLLQLGQRSGASLGPDSTLKLSFLNIPVIADIKRRTVESPEHSLSVSDKLIILHYLITAGGRTPTGKLISFKDLPGGASYFPTFYKRAIAPIITMFGNSVRNMPTAAVALGGSSTALGDSGISITVLPHVKLNWVLWQGDGVLPPEGSILFDSNIADYLPVEDIAVLCHSIAIRLCA